METKIREVQPTMSETWVRYDPNLQQSPLVQPVAKAETNSRLKPQNEGPPRSKGLKDTKDSKETSEQNKALVEEVQRFLDDFSIGLSFEIHAKTGEIVIQVLNRQTGDVIRQIPREDLVKLHEKLVELRGVLFEGKM